MKKLSLLLVVMLVVSFAVAGCGGQSSEGGENQQEAEQPADENNTPQPTEVTLAVSSWIGYAPLHIAAEKGFFEENGVNVDLQVIESVSDRRTALAADRIQGFASTVDTHVMTAAAGIPVVQILGLDTSFGGDGIVATEDIKSIQDLKGKKVALHTGGGASYFWTQYLLDREGMKLSDLNVLDMSAGDAGAAFVAGKVDAAITWQPWLTKAEETDFGHVLISSDETPGVIVDSLALREDFVKDNPEAVQGIVDAWFDALAFAAENPGEANQIMALAMDQTVEEFEATLPDVKFYDQTENQEYFGTPDDPGLLWEVSEKAADFWLAEGLIDNKPEMIKIIDGSFVK